MVAEILHLTFLKMVAVRVILYLWGKFWNDPQREFGCIYHCAKFGWNLSRFDNTSLNILRVCPENAYSCSFFDCIWGKIGEMETFRIFIPLGMQYPGIDVI